MSATIKNCNFSCTCNRDDCERKHYIDNKEDRLKVKELFETHFDKSLHKETDPDGVRNAPCFFGPLCGKSECNFKHYCSFDFRKEIMNKEWRKQSFRISKEKILTEMKDKYHISDEDIEKLRKL
jgi:uncharacterized protein (DUF1919 family)